MDEEAGVTAFGQRPYFVEFLKTSGLFEAWVKDGPLSYTSPNAPAKREVLATLLLSVLAGQRRYAHLDALRADTLAPQLLGVNKRGSAKTRRGEPSSPSTKTLANHGSTATSNAATKSGWQRSGFSMSTPRSSRSTAPKRARGRATTPPSRGVPRTLITATWRRTFGCCWEWKCSRAIRRRRRMRSLVGGSSWMSWGPSAGQSGCAAMLIGAANKRCWEPHSVASTSCFDCARPPG